VIAAVTVPANPATRHSHYIKVRDRASFEFALVSAAVALDMDGPRIRQARIALGGVGTRPWRAREAEQTLIGQHTDKDSYRRAADAALAAAVPRRDNAFKIELAKRVIVRSTAAFLVPGRAAAEYVRSLGAEHVAVAPNAIDLGIFGGRAERRTELRAKLGLDGVTFLCVSRLSPEKGVDVLVRAFEGVPGELAVVGDGPDRERVAALAGPSVRLLGRIERDELVDWYAAADAFVMPSRSETWGMAMQEAAAAGLPLIASEAPGAGYDLIEEGVNGFRVAVEDVEALRRALGRVATDEAFRARARPRTLELARGHTPEAWAGAVAGLARVVSRGGTSLFDN
jgi:glycosyltransferase involved in cell wall biosynthesis